MKRTFIYSDEKSNKFWSIETNGTSFTVNYGKVNTDGQTQVKDFADEAACQKAADKLIAEKTKKGYVEQGGTSTPAQTVKEVEPQKQEEVVEEKPEEKAPEVKPKTLDINAFVEKELVKHYNKCIHTELTDSQMIALDKFIATGNLADAAEIPPVEKIPHENDPVYRVKYSDEYKKEGPALARYIGLLYAKGGQEECLYLMSQRNYKSGMDIPGFGVVQKIEAFLHKLYEQIHYEDIERYKKLLNELFESNPAEFNEVVTNCYFLSRFRASAFLYLKNPARYGGILDGLVNIYNEVANRNGVELLLNSCALCEYKHQKLNEKLAEYFRKSPSVVVDLLEFNQDFYPAFRDEKYNKDYDSRNSTAAQINYVMNMAKHIGVEDVFLLTGVYLDCRSYYMKDVITFFKNYPAELIIDIYQKQMEKEEHVYSIARLFVDFYNICLAMNVDKAPLFKAIESKFDAYLEAYMIYKFDMEDEEPSNYTPYYDDLRAYFVGRDRSRLKKFASREHFSLFRDVSRTYEISEFTGLLAGYAPVADSVRLIAQFEALTGQMRSTAHFQKGAMAEYHWDGEALNNYFLEAYESGFVGEWGMVTFYDEMLLSDVEHKSEKIYLTQAMSDMFVSGARAFLKDHEDVAFEYSYATCLGYNIGFLRALYTENPGANPELLVNLLKEKNKALRTKALKYLPSYPSARPAVEELLNSKRKDIREYAEKALAGFENLNATSLDGSSNATAGDRNFDIAAYVKKSTPKNWQKAFVASWQSNQSLADPTTWPLVHKVGTTEPAELDYVVCYVTTYALDKDMKKMLYPEKMRSYFEESDLKALAFYLFDKWFEVGAENKSKGILTLVGIHGDVEGIKKLKDVVTWFALNSRSALAGDAVKAMAVSNSRIALVSIDNMGRTHRNKLVKRIASETMALIAESLGVTVEELADKIVPNLGLDERGEMILETGSRKLFVKLKANLTIELKNEEGKVLKSFPNRVAGDSEAYEDAKSDFTTLKKELKSLVAMQNLRLQQSLAKGRKWNKEGFEELFIQNPIMQQFATSLVFGIYTDGKLTATFRYSGDGTYADSNDDAFTLPDDADIRLVHPVELSDEDKKQWKEQFDDYELVQPFLQLSRPVFNNTDITTKTYDAFIGSTVTDYFGTKMYKMGWDRDPSGDAGSYYCMYYVGSEYAVCLDFADGAICIGFSDGDSVGLGSLYFCKTENVRVDYRANVHDNDVVPVAKIPAPFFSEVIYMLQQGVEACKEKD